MKDGIHIHVSQKNPKYVPPYHGAPYLFLFCADAGTDPHHARKALQQLRQKFPSPEYKVEATKWQSTGTTFE